MSEMPPVGNLFTLDDKVALVTRGSPGIGLHTASSFLLAGCRIAIITGRTLEFKSSSTGPRTGGSESVDALDALSGIDGKAVGIASDAASSEEFEKLANLVKSDRGCFDILACNTGAGWDGSFLATPDWSSGKVPSLNVRGIFSLAQKFTPLLQQSGLR